jgi:DNA-binding PadR family transcriptional regulator
MDMIGLTRDFRAMNACVVLSPNEVLDLAVLGVTSERARTAAEVVAAVKHIGAARFQPIADVIAGRLLALAEAGLLISARRGSSGEGAWRPSPAGREHMERLALMPSGSPVNALAAVCARLKVCFLELLQPDARQAVIEDLVAAHRRALDEAQTALAGCSCRCAFVQRCLARDVERWQAELCWLEGLAREFEARPWRQ